MLASSDATALLHAFNLALNEETGSALTALLPVLNDLPISMQGQAMQAYLASSNAFPVLPLIKALPWASWDAEGLWRAAERGQAARVKVLLDYFPSAGRNENHLPMVFACSGLNPQCMALLWPRASEDTRVKAISRFLSTLQKQAAKTEELEKWSHWMVIQVPADAVHKQLGSSHNVWSLYDQLLAQALEHGHTPDWELSHAKCLPALPRTQVVYEALTLQDATSQISGVWGKTRRI